MFILLSAFAAQPERVFPIFRAATSDEIGKLISSESRLNAETGKVEWVPTSQWAQFIHPQTVVDNGGFPIQEVGGNTKEEFLAHCAAMAEAEWAQIEQIPVKLDRYVTPEESGIDPAAIAVESSMLVTATGLDQTTGDDCCGGCENAGACDTDTKAAFLESIVVEPTTIEPGSYTVGDPQTELKA
jgi:hypothetical protein